MVAELVDLEVDKAYRAGGIPMLNWTLATNDSLEHLLSRLGAEIVLQRTGDKASYEELVSVKPPGECDVLPERSVVAARDRAKAAYLQSQRLKNGKVWDKESDDDVTKPRRRRPQRTGGPASGAASSTSQPAQHGGGGGAAGGAPGPKGGKPKGS